MAFKQQAKGRYHWGDSPYEIPLREKGLPFRISKVFYDNSRDHGVCGHYLFKPGRYLTITMNGANLIKKRFIEK